MHTTRDRLLVVEDEPAMLMVLQEILEAEGYEVYCAKDGVEALDILKMNALPDLIISDVMMPRMDGFELLRRVRRVDAWANIPFMFLTARTEMSDMTKSKTLGADDYIPKPFNYQELLNVIGTRLERYRAMERHQSTQITELKRQILMLLNHEFRTPLTLIVAYANMLKEFNDRQISHEELLEFLGNVTSGAQRLRRLVENFILLVELRYPSQNNPSYAWRMHRIDDVQELLRDALESVSRTSDEREFKFEVDANLPSFTGDRESLVIALRELIDNAIKSSRPSSAITIGAYYQDGNVTLSVEDNGRGIPPHEMDKIGQAFYQIERGKLESQGAGTGLAIVGAIASLHEGRVSVESVPDERTVFHIVIPTDHNLMPD